MNRLMQLPTNVQNEVKSTLSAYSRCTVEQKESGEYLVTTATVIHTGTYNKIIGEFMADEVFTPEEQIINYVETFRDYPTSYKGTRNYKALNQDWKHARLEQGNLVLY